MVQSVNQGAAAPATYEVVRPLWWGGQQLAVGDTLTMADRTLAAELLACGRVRLVVAAEADPAAPNAAAAGTASAATAGPTERGPAKPRRTTAA